MEKLYIIICPSVASGRSYADHMGWKESNCAFITQGDHLIDVEFDPDDVLTVLMPVDDALWLDVLYSCDKLKKGTKVKINLVQWQ